MPRLQFFDYQIVALVQFYNLATKNVNAGYLPLNEVENLNIGALSESYIKEIIKDLSSDEKVEYTQQKGYHITARGIREIEEAIFKENTFANKFYHGGSDFLLAYQSDAIPASDRTVSLDHNSSPYNETVAALDKAIEEFREDHRLDNDLSHEKGALLKALEGGRELLNDTEVNVRVATALLLEPLARIAEKFGDFVDENKAAIISGATAAAAQAAFELIKALLGLG
ncbi:hypothetical protein [Magnetovibrio blakemorei]|uniref:Uncharacterized protein n=1 Tax=Magnetovibrio blakemorei TaxID=28181 RepID=A0A1E5Q6P7_9PROT|nr:hypothetical protein [Magnetovibrio blakemorei]OEJ66566.1 hypothetical protein BEN30_11930 [Magnetovibrio blakemorei]